MVVYTLFQFDEDGTIKGIDHLEGCFETYEKAKQYATELLEERLKENIEDISPSMKAEYGEDFGKLYVKSRGKIEEIGIHGLYLYFLLLTKEVQ